MSTAIDEFDLDIRLEPAVPIPAEDAKKSKNTDPGSTCQFSCAPTCGGTCECPTNPDNCSTPQVITQHCPASEVC